MSIKNFPKFPKISVKSEDEEDIKSIEINDEYEKDLAKYKSKPGFSIFLDAIDNTIKEIFDTTISVHMYQYISNLVKNIKMSNGRAIGELFMAIKSISVHKDIDLEIDETSTAILVQYLIDGITKKITRDKLSEDIIFMSKMEDPSVKINEFFNMITDFIDDNFQLYIEGYHGSDKNSFLNVKDFKSIKYNKLATDDLKRNLKTGLINKYNIYINPNGNKIELSKYDQIKIIYEIDGLFLCRIKPEEIGLAEPYIIVYKFEKDYDFSIYCPTYGNCLTEKGYSLSEMNYEEQLKRESISIKKLEDILKATIQKVFYTEDEAMMSSNKFGRLIGFDFEEIEDNEIFEYIPLGYIDKTKEVSTSKFIKKQQMDNKILRFSLKLKIADLTSIDSVVALKIKNFFVALINNRKDVFDLYELTKFDNSTFYITLNLAEFVEQAFL